MLLLIVATAFDVQSSMDELRYTARNVFPVRIQHWGAKSAGGGTHGFHPIVHIVVLPAQANRSAG